LADCLGDDIIKEEPKKQNIPQPWRHPPKTPNPNLKSFFFQSKLKGFTSLSRVCTAR